MGFFDPGSGIIAGLLAGKPTMPGLEKLQLGEQQQKAVESNIAVMPEAEKLASGVNQFNLEQLQSMLAKSIPGYQGMKEAGSSDIEKMLKGELPISDEKMSQLSSVAKSFGSGTAGSGSMGNLVARDLGLKELDVIGKGISSAESWMGTIGSMEKPAMFDFSSMFVNPMQQYQTANEQNLQQFQHDWSKNLMDWQTSLGYLAGQEISQDSAQFNSMAGSVVGSMAGGGGGGGM